MMVAPTTRIVRSVLLTPRPAIRIGRATIVTLSPVVLEDKSLLVALIVLAREALRESGLDLGASIAVACRSLEVNRTYVYDVAARIVGALAPLATATAGRPARPAPAVADDAVAVRLQNRILRYRLDHPGAVAEHAAGRSSYSTGFRRFALEQLDAWQPTGTLESFAAAAEIPFDTLRDWHEADRHGLTPPPPPERPAVSLPRDVAPLVRDIAELFSKWEGSTRDFLRCAARRFHLPRGAVLRVLRLLGLVSPSRRRGPPPRYRGSTERLAPGSVLASDGKTVRVHLTHSLRDLSFVVHQMVDQATGCRTGSAVAPTENAGSAALAFRRSVTFLAEHRPQALVIDNRPCYSDPALAAAIAPTLIVPATLGRPQNNAIVEGTFGLFEQQVGSLHLDDRNIDALAQSAVAEAYRAWEAASNHAPRPEYAGKSRAQVLRESRPSVEQLRRDRLFLERLRERHLNPPRPPENPVSRALLDAAFTRNELAGKDANGVLRRHLARFSPDAVRRALAIFAAKRDRKALRPDFAHRYLAKLVSSCQDEVDLEIAARELLDLSRRQRELWTEAEEHDLAHLRAAASSPSDLVAHLVERAADAGLPVESAFWDAVLLEELRRAPNLIADARRILPRLYDAPFERRLALLDMITTLQEGLR